NEYMKINDEARQLKVENSKLFFQYACAETSLAKYKAECYAKSEEVKLLQSWWRKNNEPESSSASSEQIIPTTISKEKISLG
ncbi:21463_t:CDS:2, partial [Dentiscutata erythropus]